METLGSGLWVACGPPVSRDWQCCKGGAGPELCLALGAVGTCLGTWGALVGGAGSGHSILSAPGLGACGAGVWGVTAWCA